MQNTYSRLKFLAVLSVLLFFYAIAAAGSEKPSLTPLPLPFQQQEIKGVVSDNKGMPIPGVSVIIKGTNRGTVTNVDGEYTLPAAPQGSLIFSYLSFKTVEVAINGRREINIRLEEDISALDEVEINAGYYYTTKRESTGNISRVTAEEIELQPVVSPLQALQGRMAGVEIIPGGSHPGMASTIRIRGRNSLRDDGNLPLYIIDGVPINSTPLESNSLMGFTGIDPLNTLNLSNIESIEILKDADATAIYGSRGANGVVLITTMKGRSGKTNFEAQVYTGAAKVPNRLDLLNTEQYLQIRQQAFENDGVEPTASNAYDIVLWDQNRYTDWQDFFFGGTSAITNVNLSTSGGNENTTFRLGGSYHKQGTVYPGDYDYRKLTGGLNVNHLSKNRKFQMDLSILYGVDVNNLAGNVNLDYHALRLPPNAPAIFNDNSNLNWAGWAESGQTNPLMGYHNFSKTESDNWNSNLSTSFKLLPGLKIRSNFGYTLSKGKELLKLPIKSFPPPFWPFLDHLSIHLQSERKSWIVEPQLVYEKSIGKGKIDALVGTTFQQSEFSNLELQGQGYVSESLIGNLSAAKSINNVTGQNAEYRYNALFARLGINWNDRYFINFTGRRDGSSRFGPSNRFANFGAVGASWIFSEEEFIRNLFPLLSFGKLRGSFGTTGNDLIGDYAYLEAYQPTRGPGGLSPTRLSNPYFSWEENKKLEATLELGFFEGMLDFGLTWYRNRSSNQLVGYSLPSITGFTSVQDNLPATVENTGLEVELSTINLQSENFRWESSLNISFPKNELLRYPDIENSSYANRYKVGYPLNISLLYQYDGIDPETGFYRVSDVNGDGRLDYGDRIIAHNNGREFFGGFNNTITYKNFSLDFLWQFVKQEGKKSMFYGGELAIQRAEVLQAFEEGDPLQQVSQSLAALIAYNNVLQSDFSIVDASYLRLKTLSFSYALPSSVLGATGIKNGKIFISGQNLITLSDYPGMDPEIPTGGTQFSALRTITGGLQLQF